MGKRITIQTVDTAEALHERSRQAKDALEQTHWHILWRAVEGKTPQVIGSATGLHSPMGAHREWALEF